MQARAGFVMDGPFDLHSGHVASWQSRDGTSKLPARRVPYRHSPWHSCLRLSPFRNFRESSERGLFSFRCKSGWLQQQQLSQSAQAAYLSSVFGLGQIRDHFGVWAFSQRVCGRSAITNPELYHTRDSLAILSKQGKLSKPADLCLKAHTGKRVSTHTHI